MSVTTIVVSYAYYYSETHTHFEFNTYDGRMIQDETEVLRKKEIFIKSI